MKKGLSVFIVGLTFGLFSYCKQAEKSAPPTASTSAPTSSPAAQNQPQTPASPQPSASPAATKPPQKQLSLEEGNKLLDALPNTPASGQGKTPKGKGGAISTVQTKKLSASKMAFLTEQNFLFTSASDAKLNTAYQNHTLVFSKDQSFKIYNNKDVVGNGKWAFNEDDDVISLSCDDKNLNNSWKTQSFKKNWLLLGNTAQNNSGLQFRLYMNNYPPGEIPKSMTEVKQ